MHPVTPVNYATDGELVPCLTRLKSVLLQGTPDRTYLQSMERTILKPNLRFAKGLYNVHIYVCSSRWDHVSSVVIS